MSLLGLTKDSQYSEFLENRSLVSTEFMEEESPLTQLIEILAIWSNERKSRLSIELQVKKLFS